MLATRPAADTITKINVGPTGLLLYTAPTEDDSRLTVQQLADHLDEYLDHATVNRISIVSTGFDINVDE